eukprot:CAMPEP_0172817462 /NCGR_PEP_ID=MMETSP1075-20121228/13228_1 /TAXON_ID=2916 /ORGANISM="Ceratium fusus, Strain PA161109" /LENGTH=56 /DNA_ID=CAMNT_0013657669 /DNA_START=9 /DNA_END=179 /DNA_ORIENTATION=-
MTTRGRHVSVAEEDEAVSLPAAPASVRCSTQGIAKSKECYPGLFAWAVVLALQTCL